METDAPQQTSGALTLTPQIQLWHKENRRPVSQPGIGVVTTYTDETLS